MSIPPSNPSLGRIAFLGGGNMARSLIGGLAARGLDMSRVQVAEPVEALRSCLALRRLANSLLFNTCLSGALGRNGQAEFAYSSLRRALENAPEADVEVMHPKK